MTDDSVDLIFTDPIYDEEHIPDYEDLAILGKRVLKEGGSLVCYLGSMYLPEVLSLMTPHLTFWWTVCIRSNTGAVPK